MIVACATCGTFVKRSSGWRATPRPTAHTSAGSKTENLLAHARRHGHDANTEIRCGQSGVEGRRDVQAPGGIIGPRRQVPAGSTDGEDRRLRDGTPFSNGPLVRRPLRGTEVVNTSTESRHNPRPNLNCNDERRSQRGRLADLWRVWQTTYSRVRHSSKTSLEPVIMARKPLVGTVARTWRRMHRGVEYRVRVEGERCESHPVGRPANLILSYPADEYQMRDDVTPAQLEEQRVASCEFLTPPASSVRSHSIAGGRTGATYA